MLYIYFIKIRQKLCLSTCQESGHVWISEFVYSSGETNVNIAYLSRYIHSLLSGSYADEKSEVSCLLERQYKVNRHPLCSHILARLGKKLLYKFSFILSSQLVTQFSPKDFHQSAALKAFNLGKNRNIDNVCTDAYRVSITPKPGVEGSEYINATFAPGKDIWDVFVNLHLKKLTLDIV